MQLPNLAGNSRLKSQLEPQRGGGSLSHAYIIAGQVGSGRHALVNAIAAAALCESDDVSAPCGHCTPCKKVYSTIHPDVISVGEEKLLPVDGIRQLRKDVYIRPNEGRRKVYIFWNADKMNDESQNALLKVLEEGPLYAMFLLVAENEGGILQTLRSRSERLLLAPVAPVIDEIVRQWATKITAAIVNGNELALLETLTPLEKAEKGQISALFAHLQGELSRAVGASRNPKLTIHAAQICTKMQEGARQNVGVPQLLSWFTAAVFQK